MMSALEKLRHKFYRTVEYTAKLAQKKARERMWAEACAFSRDDSEETRPVGTQPLSTK